MDPFAPRLAEICDVAREAGRRILDVYQREIRVSLKEDQSPLTEADRVSHELLVARLSALRPALPVLTEESSAIAPDVRAGWRRFWLCDPLDGTKEFISRNGEFTVNIALIEEGRPILGVVHVPVSGDTYAAALGVGALLQTVDGTERSIGVRRCPDRPRVVASRSHAGPETTAFLARLGEHELLSAGSSLKFCLVATGQADVYPRLGPTMEWDTAAAQCVLEQAGGRVTDLQGAPLSYNKADLHNPWFIACGGSERDWSAAAAASGL